MPNTLLELSHTIASTGSSLIIEDYTLHPVLCRDGIWVGVVKTFTETITLSYEHEGGDTLGVGWAVDGVTIIDPGFSTGTPPWVSEPLPNIPTVLYQCPVNNFMHRISFTSTSGMAQKCFSVQALYRHIPQDQFNPPHFGPSTTVCLKGVAIEWPEENLRKERECLKRFRDLLDRYLEVAVVHPGDPIEFIDSRFGTEAIKIKAQVETLSRINVKEQPHLAAAIKANLTAIFQPHKSYQNNTEEGTIH